MNPKSNRGFSMLELLVVLVILLIISAGVFRVVNLTTERSATEQTKLDMFQEAREFMDQMSRDLRQAGYPNARNFARTVTPALVVPNANDHRVAVGLVKVAADELWFEADVDGNGEVSVIRYKLETTGNGCPCLKRSQLAKIDAAPMSQTDPVYQVEVQGVTNTTIFTAYNSAVNQMLPLTYTEDSSTTQSEPKNLAAVDTIQAVLSLQAAQIDPRTKQKPKTSLVTTVRLNNCALAATGQQTSCF